MLSEGTTISTLSGPSSLQRQECFVLPGNQHIADFALHKSSCRTACAGIEHRHVLIKSALQTPAPWLRCRRASLGRSPRPPGSSTARHQKSSGSE